MIINDNQWLMMVNDQWLMLVNYGECWPENGSITWDIGLLNDDQWWLMIKKMKLVIGQYCNGSQWWPFQTILRWCMAIGHWNVVGPWLIPNNDGSKGVHYNGYVFLLSDLGSEALCLKTFTVIPNIKNLGSIFGLKLFLMKWSILNGTVRMQQMMAE